MKRALCFCALMLTIILLLTPLQAYAVISFDGNVLPLEWYDYVVTEPVRTGISMCAINHATIRASIQPAQSRVLLGFTATTDSPPEQSAFGAVFFLSGNEIARWQLSTGASVTAADYDLQGAGYCQENIYNHGYTYEIIIHCKTSEALAALSGLSLQMIDPLGNASQMVPYPIIAEEPVTTTKAPTTEKTTTTKAPTTEKTTTTKASTTAKVTTTKAPTTAKVTTVKATTVKLTSAKTTTAQPVYTKASAVISAASQAPAKQNQPVQTYTAAQASPFVDPAMEPPTLMAEQMHSLPTLALASPQETTPASLWTPFIYAAAGLLLVLAGVLIFFWLRAQKKVGG